MTFNVLRPALGLLNQLHLDRHLDIVAEEPAAGLECLVPGEAELLPVDLPLRLEAHPLTAPRILAAALELGVERDFLRLIADREIADQLELAIDVALDALARERHRRKALDVEEVWRAEVPVALLGARVDARGRDLDLDLRLLRLRLVMRNRPLHIPEAALHGGNHQMLHGELDERVSRVDAPGRCAGRGR